MTCYGNETWSGSADRVGDQQRSGIALGTSAVQATSTNPPPAGQAAKVKDDHASSFHKLLSAMNPLQYLPIVGTLYRAITGDVIPEAVRRIGSLVVSGLLGGPIGLVVSIATTIAEKATGIDPEAFVAAQFKATSPGAAHAAATPMDVPVPTTASAMTAQQLAAYGVRSDAAGTLRLGDIEGADVLNTIQLVRLDEVATAYATTHARSRTI
jgi:hypothetical protein